jgi:RNA polymerase sigma factor (sigma-70 family)
MGHGTPTDDDDVLLARFAAGEPEAFVEFYRRHTAAIVGFFMQRTRNPELTADLTAEVFAAALLAARRYRPGERPALAWLYGIASHKLTDSRRRGRVEAEARQRLALEPLAIEDADIDRILELAGTAGARTSTRQAVEELSPEQRTAVLARVVEERDYTSIAEEMQCSELVVRQRVSRGLKNLRTRMEGSP